MKRRIAFFDFDGTITTKDSFLEIIKFQKGNTIFYLGLILCAPFLLAYKLALLSGHSTKTLFFAFFFRKTSFYEFQFRCNQFAESVLPNLIRPRAIDEINKLIRLGAKVVIVTASSPYWIRKWSDPLGITVIGTNFATKGDKLTGSIEGRNCNGEEKVNRIKANYDLSEYDEIYVYGDSSKDMPMMSLSTVRFMKPFR